MIDYVNSNICKINCEVMVNAANGIGWFGGKECTKKLMRGISESMQYATNGKIEIAAKEEIKRRRFPQNIIGITPGNYYITDGCGLPCNQVFHAVTMRLPGSHSNKKIVAKCLCNLKKYALHSGFYDIALPYLGCGIGGIDKEYCDQYIKDLFYEDFWKIHIVCNEKKAMKTIK